MVICVHFCSKYCTAGRCHRQSWKQYYAVTRQSLMQAWLEFPMLMAGKYLERMWPWNMVPLPHQLSWSNLLQVMLWAVVKFAQLLLITVLFMFWHFWLWREEHPACKNCWHDDLSGVGCKWVAYSPADATANLSSLAWLKSKLVSPFSCRLTQVVPEKRPLNGAWLVMCEQLWLNYGRPV